MHARLHIYVSLIQIVHINSVVAAVILIHECKLAQVHREAKEKLEETARNAKAKEKCVLETTRDHKSPFHNTHGDNTEHKSQRKKCVLGRTRNTKDHSHICNCPRFLQTLILIIFILC
jgi:hypothetical protein